MTDNTKPLDEAAINGSWGSRALYRLIRLGKLKAFYAKGSPAVRVKGSDVAALKKKGK